jgi:hypothetical protein
LAREVKISNHQEDEEHEEMQIQNPDVPSAFFVGFVLQGPPLVGRRP